MIVYGSTLSPFVRKVSAFAAEKGLAYELVFSGMTDPDPAFLEASPFRKMPALRDGDFTISDSSAIVHYLEAKHPEPNLIPTDPQARARTIWFEEFADTIVQATAGPVFGNRFVRPRALGMAPDLAAAEVAEREGLPPLFAYLEGQIPESGFLVADRLTLADIAVAAPFATLSCIDCVVDPETYPRTARYLAAIHARPSFAEVLERDRHIVARMGGAVTAAATAAG